MGGGYGTNTGGGYASSPSGGYGGGTFGASSGAYGSGYGTSGYRGRYGQNRNARRGPKGYERSDERLKEDISERMYANDAYDTSEVSVEVDNGVVTLDGTVDDRQTKYMIEEMVDNIPGVKDVDNRLRVNRGGGEQWQSEGSGTSGTSMLGATRSTGGFPSGQGSSESGASGSSSGTSGGSSSGSSGSSSSGSRSSGASSGSRRGSSRE